MLNRLRERLNFRLPSWTVPITLLVVCILSFGLNLRWLGFYWDDEPLIYFFHRFGPQGFLDVFTVDRPLLGYPYYLVFSVLGQSLIAWQIFGILMRYICILIVWKFLQQLWPQNPRQVLFISFLFAIYPGFQQQPITVIYSIVWLISALFYLSLALMILALRKSKRSWLFTFLALAFSALNLFSLEYYLGFELIRPFLIWVVLKDNFPSLKQRLARTIRAWLPYLGVLFLYLIWRFFIFKFPGYKPETLYRFVQNPLLVGLNLAKTIVQDILTGGLVAWLKTFTFDTQYLGGRSLLLDIGLIVLSALGIAAFLGFVRSSNSKVDPDDKSMTTRKWSVGLILMGALMLFLSGWPYWIANLPIGLSFPYDRSTLPFFLGSS